MNNQKRKRSSNFSKEEEICLLEQIEKYKNIIECKTTNKVSQSEKEKAWLKVLNEFNSKNLQTSRTLEQVKAKFDNLKTKARKEVGEKRKHIKRTGGAPAVNYDLDTVTEAVLRTINLKTVVGLNNNIDCDSDVLYNSENVSNISQKEIIIQNTDTPSKYNLDDSAEDTALILDHDNDNTAKIQNAEINTETEELLQVKELVPVKELVSEGSANKKVKPKNSSNWSEYTPKKLKLKPNKKLRQIQTDRVWETKENFYKQKLELLEKTFEAESRIREQREVREKEEHEKKMRIMDMEIILKEQQLQHDNMF